MEPAVRYPQAASHRRVSRIPETPIGPCETRATVRLQPPVPARSCPFLADPPPANPADIGRDPTNPTFEISMAGSKAGNSMTKPRIASPPQTPPQNKPSPRLHETRSRWLSKGNWLAHLQFRTLNLTMSAPQCPPSRRRHGRQAGPR